MRVMVNDECTACGICEDISPEVFEVEGDKAEVKLDPIPEEYQDACREAAEDCPAEAIEVSD